MRQMRGQTDRRTDRVAGGGEAEVLPGDKREVVRRYQRQGLVVGMVVDGINDAPALAQADIRDIGGSIHLGRATLRKIRQNLFWAFFTQSSAFLLPPSCSIPSSA